MTAQPDLEHHGKLAAHPFAELLVEILHARLSGSLRLAHDKQKAIVYMRDGRIVYAVSNSKSLRLFNILLRKKKIDTKVIGKHPNFSNDIEFSEALVVGGVLTRDEINEAFNSQMSEIVIDLLTWPDGTWTFSPLVRARENLDFGIDAYQILIDYARCAGADSVSGRFRSVQETFELIADREKYVGLTPDESAALKCFEEQPLSIEELRNRANAPEATVLRALYVLWLGGMLLRRDWNTAFPRMKLAAMSAARVSKVKDAENVEGPDAKPVDRVLPESPAEPTPETPVAKLPETKLTLMQYLEQVEKAETHYDTLGVATSADAATIKQAYFSLAKQFHPDRYHRESEATLKRIQSAFTVLAHAHEILRTPEGRDAYNSKMYKEIEAREKRRAMGQPEVTDKTERQSERGLESFEEGLNMLNDEEYEAAATYLARAVHFSPQNALYHAYYGVALSRVDDRQRHKAEAELQAAVKLDAKNVKIRMMLVDFLIDQNMLKRAEGELKRFLDVVPNNREAVATLARLKQ